MMNKSVLFFLGISAFAFSQNKSELNRQFAERDAKNRAKYDGIIAGKTSPKTEQEKDKLSGFTPNGIPVFQESLDARSNSTSNITQLQDGTMTGLNGAQITGNGLNIMVMDGGKIFEKHNEFGGPANGALRVTQKEPASVGYLDHSTRVGGILGGNGTDPLAKGVLPEVHMDSYVFPTTTLGNTYQKIANSGANISNHSYGINLGWAYVSSTSTSYPQVGWYWIANYDLNTSDTYYGSYHDEDKQLDQIVYANPQQILVKSAGNFYGGGPGASSPKFKWSNAANSFVQFADSDIIPAKNCSTGYNCIGWGALAKNIISVGAVNLPAGNVYTQPSDLAKSGFSSAGPRKDGAIKPDLTAVGGSAYAANYTGDDIYNNYVNTNGTSFSSPIVAGVAGQITQLNRIISGNSAFTYTGDEMKALLCHTADEAGNIGPDVWYGWGLVDAKNAAQVLFDKTQNLAIFEKDILTSGTPFTINILGDGSKPLKVTISWLDPAATPFTTDQDLQNNHSTMIVNDMDLRIVDTVDGSIYYPWKLDVNNPLNPATKGDNTVDNVEQVVIDNPVNGRLYRVEVTNKGTLVNASGVPTPQNFAIVATGFANPAVLGTAENISKNLEIFPTQTFDFVKIKTSEKNIAAEVYDLSGKLVLVKNFKNSGISELDFRNLQKGIYLVKVKTESKTAVQKIIRK